MHNRRLLEHFDWWIFLAVVMLMVIGFINLDSAGTATGYPFQWRQFWWYIIGIIAMLGLAFFLDYRKLTTYFVGIYISIVSVLVLVLCVGKTVGGSKRWLSLGFMNFQPSELTKLVMVIVLSSYFYHNDRPQYCLKDLLVPGAMTLVPVYLIYRQPDLGTALFLVIIFVSLVYMARIKWTSFLISLGSVLLLLPFAWERLRPYQKGRVLSFLFPERDPLGVGYHVLQSKIAIGSGQIWGKGFMAGTQAHLSFLPEVHTDFVFSMWCEEWGFVGAMLLIGIYVLILYRGFLIASQTRERFGAFLAFGVTCMLFWQVVINIGMVMGLMPVVGIPLPLISYGGSSVLTTLSGIGILLNIRSRRFMFQKERG